MVRVTEELALTPEHVTLYHTNDPLLGHLPFLIFHGPSTTANYTLNSSRIQIHVFSPAGFQSYPRITVSPNSPFYSVVSHLPREFQGDEVWRGLAFGLFKYFTELPEAVKYYLKKQYPSTQGRRPGSGPTLFSEQHAADLARFMVKSDNTTEVISVLQSALQTQHISNVDIDLVLPPWSITPLNNDELEEVPENEDDLLDPTLRQYGTYSPLVKMWGEPVFLPTSKLRRAPSRPTSLNRGKSFTKQQKVELRMKLGELVDTEERYVMKVNELVNHIAEEFRQTARNRPPGSNSPSEDEVNKLFPRSADRILQLNSGFVHELRRAMDETEEDAVRDFESAQGGVTRVGSYARPKDPSGALAVARIFLEWFPKFTESYQDYIRASQHFPQLLNGFLDKQSSFRQRVTQKGEQTVRSILIEPVQRLPRYSLLIDQIVGCIPITHPALQLMLRARDIITNICSMDEPLVDKPHVTNLLRNMIEDWPLDLEPQGRLILAIDFIELAPPFNTEQFGGPEICGILLIFSDCVVLVRKKHLSSPTGRELVRETDKPSPAGLLASMTNAAGADSYELMFIGWHHLAEVRFTESVDGRLLWMTSTREMKAAQTGDGTSKAVTSRCFILQESFEGKAAKLSEDIVKARIEGRFSERERETPAWTLRSVRMPDSNLGMHAAVFQEAAEQLVEGRREPAPIRIVVDNEKGTKGHPVGHYGVEIVTEIRSGDLRRIRMITLGLNGKQYTDDIALEDLLPTLSRRIIQLFSTQFNVSNIRLAPSLVSYYTKIVRNLSFNSRAEKTRSFLSSSPVKMLSSFLTGSASDIASQGSPKQQRGMLSPPPVITRAGSWKESKESLVDSIRSRGSRDTVGMAADDERIENPLVRLEQTFTGYVACLQSRKGHFVGRLVLNRSAAADELTVNDLYNRLIESPFDLEASSDVSSETVFVTFEKFVRIAWQEQMGPVMSPKHLDLLLERASRRVPGEFGDFVRYLFNEMAPQNRRAFTALIKLLANLLDGCSNDSDRGALTLAFAELLVDDGSAHNYINLLDRLVEDCDRIFEDPLATLVTNSFERSSAYESMYSTTRSYKSASGSLTSNTSSLRRKFGFDNLLRQNSKNEGDRQSMWRTLSKHSRHPASGDSLGRSAVERSQTIDIGGPNVPNKLRRPGSHDRPRVAGAFDDLHVRPPSAHRPGSSHHLESNLETIGEPETEMLEPPKSLKKKRRSSLSDLKNLMDTTEVETVEEPPTMPLNISKQTSEKFNSAPRIPPPSKIPISPTSTRSSKSNSPPGLSKIPITPKSQSMRTPRAREPPRTEPLRHVFATPQPPSASVPPLTRRKHAKTMSTSNIPNLKPTRMPTAGAYSPTHSDLSRATTSSSRSSAQRLKLQSPQRLRERMETEKKAIEDVGAGLKTELSRISQDMARVNGTPRSSTGDIRKLSISVRTLEERLPQVLHELEQRRLAIQEDMEATVKASEAKVKAIDQMYKEATAENELLYEKFNSELGKIVKALRGKGREEREELVTKLKDTSEETAYVKKENARLRREIVSLRALLKSGNRDD